MGCLWYYVNNASAVGFLIKPQKVKRELLGEVYGALVVDENAFVYDKRTISFIGVDLPSGVYESDYMASSTEIKENKNLNRFLASEISEMEKIFGTKCAYWSVMSTEDMKDIEDFDSDDDDSDDDESDDDESDDKNESDDYNCKTCKKSLWECNMYVDENAYFCSDCYEDRYPDLRYPRQ